MWTFVLLGCFSVSLVMSLAFCLCWRKKSPKNDLLGLDGMVIQKNPDENVNHLPSAAPCVVEGLNAAANTDINESNRRSVPATNTRRSLPDIPSEQGAAVTWEPTGDNSSEHYATVGQFQNGIAPHTRDSLPPPPVSAAKRHTTHNGVDARPSISQHSSISQADDTSSPYEKVKYDKIKSKEHPYAQLQPTTSRQAVLEETKAEERTSLLRPDGSSTSSEPSAPPRSRRSSANSGLGVDIPAASAVAGGIAASPDLPYMTPPVTQPNFSGDSQDSSKGYTSISVREPLANIMAQTKELSKKRELDQHYSTVSDDSDDVYTTIPDPNNQIYTSESETYARIPAHPITVEAEVNPAPARSVENEFYEAAPQPPPPNAATFKQTVHSHSRQASSSSSVANVGSPKPEKRQANSPLPPPPAPAPRNLDDLYAKVHKPKKKDESDGEPEPRNGDAAATAPSRSPSSERAAPEHDYETLRKLHRDREPGYERVRPEEPGYASINGPESLAGSDPGYEVLRQRQAPDYEELRLRRSRVPSSDSREPSLDEPNYESMPSESLGSAKSGSESDPNYERVRDLEPPYERLGGGAAAARGYENIDTSESSNGERSGPPYERLREADAEAPEGKGGLLEEDAIFQV